MNRQEIDAMSSDVRVDAIVSILTAGILRIKHRNNSQKRESFPLDKRSESRLHEENKNSEKTGGSS